MTQSLKIPAWLSPDSLDFPDPSLALDEPNGLLAVGGDLSPERLIKAYESGIFPWYNEDQPILWWSPDPRAILYPDKLKISHSLQKRLNKADFTISQDKAFEQVVQACAAPRPKQEETWITPEMIEAYCELHRRGIAHSFEVWRDVTLIGGLYGVHVSSIFCGESMFSLETDASKIALVALCDWAKQHQIHFIDCQLQNPHLESMGAVVVSRREFLGMIDR